jgi:hypothetical protein
MPENTLPIATSSPLSAAPEQGRQLGGDSSRAGRRKPWFAPQWVGTALFFLILGGSLGAWWMVHGHLLASSDIMLKGGKVDWNWSEGRWMRGGETSVDFTNAGYQLAEKDISHLGELNHVISLNLNGCLGVKEEELVVLEKLPELQALDLGRFERSAVGSLRTIPRLTDKVLDHLHHMTRLRELIVSGSDITDAGLAKVAGLKNLEVLDLTDTQVTDAGLKCLKSLPRLRLLVVDSPGVTPEGSAFLLQTNPNLSIEHPTDPSTAVTRGPVMVPRPPNR